MEGPSVMRGLSFYASCVGAGEATGPMNGRYFRRERGKGSPVYSITVKFSNHHPLRRARETGSAGVFCV
jgi:hypothetical protein